MTDHDLTALDDRLRSHLTNTAESLDSTPGDPAAPGRHHRRRRTTRRVLAATSVVALLGTGAWLIADDADDTPTRTADDAGPQPEPARDEKPRPSAEPAGDVAPRSITEWREVTPQLRPGAVGWSDDRWVSVGSGFASEDNDGAYVHESFDGERWTPVATPEGMRVESGRVHRHGVTIWAVDDSESSAPAYVIAHRSSDSSSWSEVSVELPEPVTVGPYTTLRPRITDALTMGETTMAVVEYVAQHDHVGALRDAGVDTTGTLSLSGQEGPEGNRIEVCLDDPCAEVGVYTYDELGLVVPEPRQDVLVARSGEDVASVLLPPGSQPSTLALVGSTWLVLSVDDFRILATSSDGSTWREVPDQGARYAAMTGDLVLGVDRGDGRLRVSADGGHTWTSGALDAPDVIFGGPAGALLFDQPEVVSDPVGESRIVVEKNGYLIEIVPGEFLELRDAATDELIYDVADGADPAYVTEFEGADETEWALVLADPTTLEPLVELRYDDIGSPATDAADASPWRVGWTTDGTEVDWQPMPEALGVSADATPQRGWVGDDAAVIELTDETGLRMFVGELS